MKVPSKFAAVVAAIAFGLVPATALAIGNGSHGRLNPPPGHGKGHSKPQGHGKNNGNSSPSSTTTKAYGKYCQSESKKHVAGQQGTPFSNCVTDMAQLAKSSRSNPHTVCANESKDHVAGQKGTPYSQCVSAAAKLRKDR